MNSSTRIALLPGGGLGGEGGEGADQGCSSFCLGTKITEFGLTYSLQDEKLLYFKPSKK